MRGRGPQGPLLLDNYELLLREESFYTRKIIRLASQIKYRPEKKLFLGNLYYKRGWRNLRDYVEGMRSIFLQAEPDEYVLATGRMTSIGEYLETAFKKAGMTIVWLGKVVEEKAGDAVSDNFGGSSSLVFPRCGSGPAFRRCFEGPDQA